MLFLEIFAILCQGSQPYDDLKGNRVSRCCPEYVPAKWNLTANGSLITVPLGWRTTLFLGPNGKYNHCKLILLPLGVRSLTGSCILMCPIKSVLAAFSLWSSLFWLSPCWLLVIAGTVGVTYSVLSTLAEFGALPLSLSRTIWHLTLELHFSKTNVFQHPICCF